MYYCGITTRSRKLQRATAEACRTTCPAMRENGGRRPFLLPQGKLVPWWEIRSDPLGSLLVVLVFHSWHTTWELSESMHFVTDLDHPTTTASVVTHTHIQNTPLPHVGSSSDLLLPHLLTSSIFTSSLAFSIQCQHESGNLTDC